MVRTQIKLLFCISERIKTRSSIFKEFECKGPIRDGHLRVTIHLIRAEKKKMLLNV